MVGKHCESGDVLVRDACVPEDLEVGDVLATPVTGAYGHSMASNYNKVPRPPVVFVKGAGSWRGGAPGDLRGPVGSGRYNGHRAGLPGQGLAPVASLPNHRSEPHRR